MRLVVTGASGFIGRNVLLRAPRSWEIFAVYHRSTDFSEFLRAPGLAHVRSLQCDLTQADQVRELRARIEPGPEAVLYLAASGDPSWSVEDPLGDLHANTVALVNFLEHCSVPHLVYVSSGAVYDGLTGAVSPASPVNPGLPYAISKLASEGYIRFYADKRGAPGTYAIVRFFGAYGPYEPPRKITSRFLRAVAEGQREFTIRGDGQNLIDFMYVDDAVDGFLRLVGGHRDRLTLDFASGAPMTLDELVGAMAHALEVTLTLRHEGETAEYIRFHSVDPTTRNRFGIAPVTPFGDGLRRLQAFALGR